LFGKRKRRIAKQNQPAVVPQTHGETITAHEKAYLDQLEQMIMKPGLTPYIRRNGPSRQEPEESQAVEPVFDSGPLTANQVATACSNGGVASPAPTPARGSLATADGHVRLGTDGVYELSIDVPSADLDVEDQAPPSRSSRTIVTPPPRPRPAVEVVEPLASAENVIESALTEGIAQSAELFPGGTLVVWNSNHLGVYKKHLEEKGYDLLYVVESDGRLQPKGICLFAYQPRRVGMLSEGILQWMERTMRWDRDALVFHFDDPNEARAIPALGDGSTARPASVGSKPVGAAAGTETLVRGRTFTINVGQHQWQGIYWGRDAIGTVVAHDTNRVWSLMHLDLDRFGSGLKLGKMLSAGKILEIEDEVKNGN